VPAEEVPDRELPDRELPPLDPPDRDPAVEPGRFEVVVRDRAPPAARGRPVRVAGLGSPLVPLADRGRLVPVRGRAALLGARVAIVPTVARNRLRSKDPVCSRVSRRVATPPAAERGALRLARACVIWFATTRRPS
jgi:hypothetical protein